MSTTYVSWKRERLTMELGVGMTRQNFGSLFLLRVVVVRLCQGKGGQRSTRARGRLSEAKTQRRPHSAREIESERGGFLCCFCCICIFQQGKKRHVEETVMAKRGERVKRGGGVRRAAA